MESKETGLLTCTFCCHSQGNRHAHEGSQSKKNQEPSLFPTSYQALVCTGPFLSEEEVVLLALVFRHIILHLLDLYIPVNLCLFHSSMIFCSLTAIL